MTLFVNRLKHFAPITAGLALALCTACATVGSQANNEPDAAATQATPSTQVTKEGFTPAPQSSIQDGSSPPAAQSASAAPQASGSELSVRLMQMEAQLQALQAKLDSYERGKKDKASAREVPIQKHPSDELAEIPGETKIPATGQTDRDSAIEKFRSARIQLESGKYSEAILAFTDFVNTYGDHVLAGPAQALIGEAYYQQKEYRLAESEFKRVLLIYPRCSSVPETLARLAEIQEINGDASAASQSRQRLTSLFPNSPAAQGFMNKSELRQQIAQDPPPQDYENAVDAAQNADAGAAPSPQAGPTKRLIPPSTAPLPEGQSQAQQTPDTNSPPAQDAVAQ